jgi:hypothetical protein
LPGDENIARLPISFHSSPDGKLHIKLKLNVITDIGRRCAAAMIGEVGEMQ